MAINYSAAIFLINDNARAIRGVYEEHASAKRETFKTFEKDIKVGDFVAVQSDTRHNITIVKVVETNVIVDSDSEEKIKWVVQKLDLTSYQNLVKQEEIAIEHIKLAEAQQKRDELKAKMGNYFANVKPLELTVASTDNDSSAA